VPRAARGIRDESFLSSGVASQNAFVTAHGRSVEDHQAVALSASFRWTLATASAAGRCRNARPPGTRHSQKVVAARVATSSRIPVRGPSARPGRESETSRPPRETCLRGTVSAKARISEARRRLILLRRLARGRGQQPYLKSRGRELFSTWRLRKVRFEGRGRGSMTSDLASCVEDGQELPSARGQGDVLGLPAATRRRRKPNHRIEADTDDAGHVEKRAHLRAAPRCDGVRRPFGRFRCERCDADESGDLLGSSFRVPATRKKDGETHGPTPGTLWRRSDFSEKSGFP